MSKEFEFFIYLLERYAEHRGQSAADVLALLKSHNLYDYAINMYELYHVETLDNAFADLDRRIALGLLG